MNPPKRIRVKGILGPYFKSELDREEAAKTIRFAMAHCDIHRAWAKLRAAQVVKLLKGKV